MGGEGVRGMMMRVLPTNLILGTTPVPSGIFDTAASAEYKDKLYVDMQYRV
jgi:hypothetical protein